MLATGQTQRAAVENNKVDLSLHINIIY